MSLLKLYSLVFLSIIFFLISPFFHNQIFATSSWSVVTSPNANPTGYNIIESISTVFSNDVWAVGGYHDDSNNTQSLIEHWNGANWNIIPSPILHGSAGLHRVKALSTNNVWAVGGLYSGQFAETLIEHWDGVNWSVINSPNPPTSTTNHLTGIEAVSPNDIWAVGVDYSSNHSFFEHYDGANWSIVDTSASPEFLGAMSALSSNDVWATGNSFANVFGGVQPLFKHWDGTNWTIVPNPSLSGNINSITAISANDVWAAGFAHSLSYPTGSQGPLLMHYNGTDWNVVIGPPPNNTTDMVGGLYGISAVSANDIWAVGSGGSHGTALLHYDGTNWTSFPSPDIDNELNSGTFYAVDAISSGDVWAGGLRRSTTGEKTLFGHYSLSETNNTLNVPLLKQGIIPFDNNSPVWEGEEFDHTNTRQFTCGKLMWECGCSTTSVAMVLKYYGVNYLPDGQGLNPGTLNTWLKNNNGYNRNLGVVWGVAATLASKAKSRNPDFMYDGLEYNRVSTMDKTQLINDINNKIPDILEVPNHYIVAKGIDGNTFSINDPYHNRTTLASYENSFLSLGRYIPSHTDMSYIVFVIENDVNILVKDATGSIVGENYTEYPIVNPEQQTGSLVTDKSLKIFQYPKPSTGIYSVSLNSSTAKNYQMDQYIVTQNGDVDKKTLSGPLATNINADFSLSYDKQSTINSTIELNITLNILKSDLQKLYGQGFINNKGIFTSLETKVEIAIKASNLKPQVLRNKLTVATLKVFLFELNAQRDKHITEEAYQVLKNETDYLIKSYQK